MSSTNNWAFCCKLSLTIRGREKMPPDATSVMCTSVVVFTDSWTNYFESDHRSHWISPTGFWVWGSNCKLLQQRKSRNFINKVYWKYHIFDTYILQHTSKCYRYVRDPMLTLLRDYVIATESFEPVVWSKLFENRFTW